jgi:hypothetical protein
MAKKEFVSISFASSKLQILKLNTSRTKAEKTATVELPQGVIIKDRVQNPKALAEIITNLWKKIGLREKNVGIIIPEQSTFMKSLKFPHLDHAELDEAVEWQMKDYLPKDTLEMSMDWKIVGGDEDENQILTIAVGKDILEGFVDSVGQAGLYPIAVETPSIALERVTKGELLGKLIIYKFFENIILVIADGGNILGSSVVSSGNDQELINTARRIISHYDKLKVEKVLLGGTEVNQQFAAYIQNNLKIPVGPLNVGVEGLSKEDVQSYLISLSMQFKDATGPEDETTINLLPKAIVDKYKRKRTEVQIWTTLTILTFIIWSSFIAVLGTYVFFTQQISSYRVKNGASLNVISQTEEARVKITEINKDADSVLKILATSVQPQEVFNSLESVRPNGITISRYELNLDDGEILLSGLAQNRTDLIEFKQALEKMPEFSDITLPLSYLEIESNLNFRVNFKYQKRINIDS